MLRRRSSQGRSSPPSLRAPPRRGPARRPERAVTSARAHEPLQAQPRGQGLRALRREPVGPGPGGGRRLSGRGAVPAVRGHHGRPDDRRPWQGAAAHARCLPRLRRRGPVREVPDPQLVRHLARRRSRRGRAATAGPAERDGPTSSPTSWRPPAWARPALRPGGAARRCRRSRRRRCGGRPAVLLRERGRQRT